MITMRKTLNLWLAGGLAMTILFAGCAASDEKKAPAQEQVNPPPSKSLTAEPGRPPAEVKYYVHTVKWSGETVSIIAGWYTGDIQNWRALAQANPDIDPDRIHTGMQIRIPEEIIKSKTPMTKGYVDSFYSKARKRPGKKPPVGPKADEPPADGTKLFGPK